jgi:hypothetical protein
MKFLNSPVVKRFGLLLFLVSSLIMITGCTTDWVTQAVNIINVVVPAIGQILGLIMAFGGTFVTQAEVDMVNKITTEATKDLQTVVKPLLDQYNAATAAAKPGIIAKLQAAIQVIITNIASILPALHITNAALQAKIEMAIGFLLATLQSLLSVLPIVSTVKTAEEFGAAMEAQGITPPLTSKQIKDHFNHLMKSRTGDPEVDAKAPQFVVS